MWNGKSVSVVFPAYNEAENIRHAVEDFLAQEAVDEVIVVNNNSRDETADEVAKTRARLVNELQQGYGHALRRGLREAHGDLIILAEPDGTFLGRDVLKLLSYSEDFELVLGSRTSKELIWAGANMDWFLRMGNVAVAKMLEWLFNTPSLSDCGCTLRLITQPAAAAIRDDLTVGGSHFLPEMVILARKKGVRMIEIPVNYAPRKGTSKITGTLRGTLVTGTNMIRLILGYRFGVR